MKNRYIGYKRAYCKDNGTRKVRHKTLADAKAFRRLIHEEREVEYSRIYKCPACKGYHLTTRRPTYGAEPSTVWRVPEVRQSRGILPYIQPMIEQVQPWNSLPSKTSQAS